MTKVIRNYLRDMERNIEFHCHDAIKWTYQCQHFLNESFDGEKSELPYKELIKATGFSKDKLDKLMHGPNLRITLKDFMTLAYCSGYELRMHKIEHDETVYESIMYYGNR